RDKHPGGRPDGAGRQEVKPWSDCELDQQDRVHIRAETEEADIADQEKPGETGADHPAQSHDGEQDGEHDDLQLIRLLDDEPEQPEDQRREQTEDELQIEPVATDPRDNAQDARPPNRPRGIASRITTKIERLRSWRQDEPSRSPPIPSTTPRMRPPAS